jgi:glycosyltransferase involved in cell wall biosynthesis
MSISREYLAGESSHDVSHDLDVLHEYGAPAHFRPHRLIAAQRGGQLRMATPQYLRHALSLLRRGDFTRARRLGEDTRVLRSIFRRTTHPVVIGFAPYHWFAPALVALRRRRPVVLLTSWPRWEEEPVHSGGPLLQASWRALLRDLPAVGVTRTAASSVAALGARSRVIPHPVDTTELTPDFERKRTDRARFVFAGRLVEAKGLRELAAIIESWNGPPVEWQFAGDGPERARLEALARGGYPVELLGHRTGAQLTEVYRAATALVLPSFRVPRWEEIFGLCIIEAMACGTPCVATDCIGPSEIIEDGRTGYLVRQHDRPALRDRLLQLASAPERALELGRAAREAAVERYELRRVAKQWESVLDDAARAHEGGST